MSNRQFPSVTKRINISITDRIVQKSVIYPITLLFAIGLLWEGIVQFFNISEMLLPGPMGIIESLIANHETLWTASIQTLEYIIAGFVAGSLLGILLGILVASSKVIERALQPILVTSFVVPKIAFAPLLLLWFGAGPIFYTVMPLLLVFFPLVESTVTGIRGVDNNMRDLARLYNAKRVFTYKNIVIPSSMPNIMAGLKIGMTQAVIGVIIAEFVAPERGLGYILLLSETFGNPKLSFASIVVTGFIGIILYKIVEVTEHRLLFWQEVKQ